VRKHRVALATAAAITLLLVTGVVAVVVVQVRANRELAAKNAQLAEEQAKVEKRFELAQKAIAKLHSGVSEDLLLRTDQFKDLRTQLLKQAADFYGDLEKLLENQTDANSRRLLAAGNFQLADLTGKIGSQPEALAIHRKALAIRRELASPTGTDVETRLDVARSLGAVGLLLYETGDVEGGMRALYGATRRSRRTLVGASDDGGPGGPGSELHQQSHGALVDGEVGEGAGGERAGRCNPAAAGRGQPLGHRTPVRRGLRLDPLGQFSLGSGKVGGGIGGS